MAAQLDAQEKELVQSRVELAKMAALRADLEGSEQRVRQLQDQIDAKDAAIATVEAEVVRCATRTWTHCSSFVCKSYY